MKIEEQIQKLQELKDDLNFEQINLRENFKAAVDSLEKCCHISVLQTSDKLSYMTGQMFGEAKIAMDGLFVACNANFDMVKKKWEIMIQCLNQEKQINP